MKGRSYSRPTSASRARSRDGHTEGHMAMFDFSRLPPDISSNRAWESWKGRPEKTEGEAHSVGTGASGPVRASRPVVGRPLVHMTPVAPQVPPAAVQRRPPTADGYVGRRSTQRHNPPNPSSRPSLVTPAPFSSSQRHAPGAVVIARAPSERVLNPERLDLRDNNLTQCPLLEDEDRLRLLNLENNMIRKITNMVNLPSLVFLDLYNNQVEEINGLDMLVSLRVLMLGRNKIHTVEGLGKLASLDVLDLHKNMISSIENLSHLNALRVLNLAGNQLSVVDGLKGLDSLTELNLRRNQVETVTDVDTLPALHRLFLSHNNINTFEAIEPVLNCTKLEELVLESNVVAARANYRDNVIGRLGSLRTLDAHFITGAERAVAMEFLRPPPSPSPPAIPSKEEEEETSPELSPKSERWNEAAPIEHTEENSDAVHMDSHGCLVIGAGGQENPLAPYSNARSVIFRGIGYDATIACLKRLRACKYEFLRRAVFQQNGFTHVVHVIRAVRLLQHPSLARIDEVTVHHDGNPVVALSIFRLLCVSVLPANVHVFNGAVVRDDERIIANKMFGRSLALLNEDKEDKNATNELRSSVRRYLDGTIASALATEDKLRRVQDAWPAVMKGLIEQQFLHRKEFEASLRRSLDAAKK